MSLDQVIKRDGEVVDFDRNRIEQAIYAAARAVGNGVGKPWAETLSWAVTGLIEERFGQNGHLAHVEDVQDAVEEVLIKSGILLPDSGDNEPVATLTWNDSGKFEDRWVQLRVSGTRCVFLRDVQRLYLPVAHAEGKFVVRQAALLEQLDAAGQLTLRYEAPGGQAGGPVAYPLNPNGSQANVAGVCDVSGRVFGLMPHPERFVDPTQHPQWTP